MNFDITNFQTLAANLPIEGEVCDLTHAEVSTQTEINTEIVPLIQQVADTSIAEIDRSVTELQEVKSQLQSRGQRVEREMVRYTKLTQMASFTAKIILDTISMASREQPTKTKRFRSHGGFDREQHGCVREKLSLRSAGHLRTVRSLMPLRGARRMPTRAWHLHHSAAEARASDRGQPAPDEAC